MNKSIIVSMFIMVNPLLSNIAPEGFERFPNYYFVETGTAGGNGIRFALRANFPEIHSIEINSISCKKAKAMFSKNDNVRIWEGDSGEILRDVIASMDEPITFWLDGHCCPPRRDGGQNTPLIEELEQIKSHPLKNHTILIDDMHCCDTIYFDFLSKDQIISKVLEINPEYTIFFVDGGDAAECKNNIMVAQVMNDFCNK